MTALFLKLFNLSLSAGWLVLAILLVRLLLRRAPAWCRCALWGILAVRLLCPVSLESPVSLLPTAEAVPKTVLTDRAPLVDTGFETLDAVIDPLLEAPAPEPTAALTEPLPPTDFPAAPTETPLQKALRVAGWVWLAGAVGLMGWAVFSWARVKWLLRTAVREDGVWYSERVTSPFVMGMVRPRIYLPFHVSPSERAHVLAHERAHIHRGDPVTKPLGFWLLSVYWFHPLMWVAYILFCRDMEIACDERTVKGMAPAERRAYSASLLNCSMRRHMALTCPLAFGEVGVKERVKRVINYKKPGVWITAIALVAAVALAVCFLTIPLPKAAAKEKPVFEVLSYDSDLEGAELYPKDFYYTNGTLKVLFYWSDPVAADWTYIYVMKNGDYYYKIERQEGDRWVDCFDPSTLGEETVWEYTSNALGSFEDLSHFDMSKEGIYRLEVLCNHTKAHLELHENDNIAHKLVTYSTTFRFVGTEHMRDTGDSNYFPVECVWVPKGSKKTAEKLLREEQEKAHILTDSSFVSGEDTIYSARYDVVEEGGFWVPEELKGTLDDRYTYYRVYDQYKHNNEPRYDIATSERGMYMEIYLVKLDKDRNPGPIFRMNYVPSGSMRGVHEAFHSAQERAEEQQRSSESEQAKKDELDAD